MTNAKIKTNTPPKKKAANIQVDKLRTFEGHPLRYWMMKIWAILSKVSDSKALSPR